MSRLPEYPLTPERQVGTMYTGPEPGQGQFPRMLYRLRDVLCGSCRAVPSTIKLVLAAVILKG